MTIKTCHRGHTYEATQRKHNCPACRRVAQARYEATDKARAVHARYAATAKGRHTTVRRSRVRLFIGHRYVGMAATIEQAAVINAHIKERVREFVTRQQAGTQAEGVSTGAVSAEAKP